VFYVVNSGSCLSWRSDAVTTASTAKWRCGAAANPRGGFSNFSLNGKHVISLTGYPYAGVDLVWQSGGRIAHRHGNGALSLTSTRTTAGTQSVTGAAGRYNVASDGRGIDLRSRIQPRAYLVNSNQAFLFVSDAMFCRGSANPRHGLLPNNSALKARMLAFTANRRHSE